MHKKSFGFGFLAGCGLAVIFMSTLESLTIGVISGLVAAALFWLGQFMMRPCIEASAKAIVNDRVSIKIKNCTWQRSLIDVNMALFHVTQSETKHGDSISNHESIPLKTSSIFEMKKKDKKHVDGAWTVRGKIKRGFKFKKSDSLLLRVCATDEWFNVKRVVSFKYVKSDIIYNYAEFESGRSLKIKYDNNTRYSTKTLETL